MNNNVCLNQKQHADKELACFGSQRLARAFSDPGAFIGFITAGDPNIEATEKFVLAMQAGGADLIEIGIPFSDPTAEGPVIEAADLRALAGGITVEQIFNMVKKLRKSGALTVPVALMTYYNPVFVYGIERFCTDCDDCGVDCVIIPDLPFEERKEFTNISDAYQVSLISMIAPTSHDRIKRIAREAEGFIYVVSSLGVTGVRENITTDLSGLIHALRAETTVPAAIGFGIAVPEQAERMCSIADGVITGSAIVRLAEKYGQDAAAPIQAYVKSMKEGAMRGARRLTRAS